MLADVTKFTLIIGLQEYFYYNNYVLLHVCIALSAVTKGYLLFIRPSSDGTYYGMVMSVRPSVRPGLRPSVRLFVRPGLRPPVFHNFLLHALTYWAAILHMAFSYCTTDQVRVSSLCVNFWRSYASLWTQNIDNVQFSALFSYVLWHFELKFCTWLSLTVLQIKFECCHFMSIFEGVMPLCELRI